MGALINECVLLAWQQQIFVDHCAHGPGLPRSPCRLTCPADHEEQAAHPGGSSGGLLHAVPVGEPLQFLLLLNPGTVGRPT
jgi:hypothetical protein